MEAIAVMVGEAQLRAGVGALAPDDQPGLLGTTGQVHVLAKTLKITTDCGGSNGYRTPPMEDRTAEARRPHRP